MHRGGGVVAVAPKGSVRRRPSARAEQAQRSGHAMTFLGRGLDSRTKWNRRTSFGGSSLEPPRPWLGAQWLGLTPGVSSCAEPERLGVP